MLRRVFRGWVAAAQRPPSKLASLSLVCSGSKASPCLSRLGGGRTEAALEVGVSLFGVFRFQGFTVSFEAGWRPHRGRPRSWCLSLWCVPVPRLRRVFRGWVAAAQRPPSKLVSLSLVCSGSKASPCLSRLGGGRTEAALEVGVSLFGVFRFQGFAVSFEAGWQPHRGRPRSWRLSLWCVPVPRLHRVFRGWVAAAQRPPSKLASLCLVCSGSKASPCL